MTKTEQKKIDSIISILRNHESVCLSGIPKIGINTYISNVVQGLIADSTKILYDSDNTLTVSQISKWLDITTNGFRILILPFLSRKDNDFLPNLSDILSRVDNHQICTLTHISVSQYLQITQSKTTNTKLFGIIDIVKPFDFEETVEYLRTYKNYHTLKKYQREIFILSGGIVGLIKRLTNYISYYNQLADIEVLVNYIPINKNLINIHEHIAKLNKEELATFGLIDQDGNFVSKLIENYQTRTIGIGELVEIMTSNELKIFELLSQNLGQVVSSDQIDKSLRGDEFSFWGNYRAISRLRKKVESKYVIKSVKGKGYLLNKKYV